MLDLSGNIFFFKWLLYIFLLFFFLRLGSFGAPNKNGRYSMRNTRPALETDGISWLRMLNILLHLWFATDNDDIEYRFIDVKFRGFRVDT